MDPPEYERPGPPLKSCEYCPSQHTEEQYKHHVLSLHSDLVFHCDNCDNYIDKRDFILHMSFHAVQYAAENVKTEKGPKKVVKKPKKRRELLVKDENENTESTPVETQPAAAKKVVKSEPPVEKLPNASRPENNDNEFSDHSDTEYTFGPLPESVFEAIEDSQDSQPHEEPSPDKTEEKSLPKKDEKSTKKPRKCPVCGRVYTAASSYFYHIKYTHKRTREYECALCKQKFKSKMSLNQHMSLHNGKLTLGCRVCPKKFNSKASLYIHEQIHQGVKKYSCDQCSISFRWRTHLVRHMKRHSPERTHACATCGRAFAIRCDLLRHARTHTAGDFKCAKCGHKFAQMRYLKVHMNKKHAAV